MSNLIQQLPVEVKIIGIAIAIITAFYIFALITLALADKHNKY